MGSFPKTYNDPQTNFNGFTQARIALKLEKVGRIFSSFNTRLSLPSVATEDRK